METTCDARMEDDRNDQENDHERVDPALMLGMDLMAHIFSFVGGGHGKYKANIAPCVLHRPGEAPIRLLRLDEACRLATSSFPLVSKTWKQVLATRLSSILGPIQGTFHTLDNFAQVDSCILWIIANRLSMGSILMYSNECIVDSRRVLQLLATCDMTHLEKLAVNIIFATAEKQTQLYDLIAENCPNVKELAITMYHPPPDPQHKLFHMPSIQWMHLYLSKRFPLAELPISRLGALRELRVSGGMESLSGNPPYLLQIGSTSLQKLFLENLNPYVFVSCHCPALQLFVCNTKSGSFPRMRLHQQQVPRDVGTLHTTADKKPFWKLQVPPTCRIVVEGYIMKDWQLMRIPWQTVQRQFPE